MTHLVHRSISSRLAHSPSGRRYIAFSVRQRVQRTHIRIYTRMSSNTRSRIPTHAHTHNVQYCGNQLTRSLTYRKKIRGHIPVISNYTAKQWRKFDPDTTLGYYIIRMDRNIPVEYDVYVSLVIITYFSME